MSNTAHAVNAAVPVVGAVYASTGLTYSEIAAVATLVYVLISIVIALPKFLVVLCDTVRKFKAWRNT